MRVGVVGTGFVARGLIRALAAAGDEFTVTRVLTRRDPRGVSGVPRDLLTRSTADLVEHADVLFEASGDAVHGTDVLLEAFAAGRPVVTMDSELQVTTGSWFAARGVLTEADGDQPGCLARLADEAVGMGFRPLAYLNLKGFLDPDPTPESMAHWSERQDLRLEQTVSFTDGSKLQAEQVLVANGLGASIAREGLLGPTVESPADAGALVEAARRLGQPLSDYLLWRGGPPGVLLLADHPEAAALPGYLPFSRLFVGDDRPCFSLVRPHHLIHLEAVRTLRDVRDGRPPLLNNGPRPRYGLAAVTKRPLAAGAEIERGVGSFDVRGTAVRLADRPDHVPATLLAGARVRADLPRGHVVRFEDVELRPCAALELYREVLALALRPAEPVVRPATDEARAA
ncbi:MAG: NAD(P)-dependent oxidoreductase [Planctomycetes bacterium]|nr:NAD(P)-dependent oxidoreductase [Planctomycetota bacterium]